MMPILLWSLAVAAGAAAACQAAVNSAIAARATLGAALFLNTVVGPGSDGALIRMGAATALALMVLGQGVMALVIDHHGLWGMRPVPVTAPRLLGVACLVAGMLLLRR